MIDIRDPSYTELLVEFLTSLILDKKGIDYEKPKVVQFRLGGKQFSLFISEFRIALGLYREPFIAMKLYQNSSSHRSGSRAWAFWR